MRRPFGTVSLVAERAVRYLTNRRAPVASVEMARAVLATRVSDESVARSLLESAFAGDPRLVYEDGTWRAVAGAVRAKQPRTPAPSAESDRVLLVIEGERPARGRRFSIRSVCVVRVEEGAVVAACGGDLAPGRSGRRLRRAVLELVEGAVPVIHDAPGAIASLEAWLGETLPPPISLRRLGQLRLGLRRDHSFAELAAKLGVGWRETDDPADLAEALEACLGRLRRPGETLDELRLATAAGAPSIDWSRFAFDREFLKRLPPGPGVYRFYDGEGKLLYVGRSSNLRRRVWSYFVEGTSRTPRVQALLDAVHRIEIEPSGSDLEAVLREAAIISSRGPRRNVQRRVHPDSARAARLGSMMILEPAAPPGVLRAYLIRDAQLLEKVAVGPGRRGLRRLERILEDRFFSYRPSPSSARETQVDVELVARWLAEHRDRAVAFDPTDLPSARQVILRLEWFLSGAPLMDPTGLPTLPR